MPRLSIRVPHSFCGSHEKLSVFHPQPRSQVISTPDSVCLMEMTNGLSARCVCQPIAALLSNPTAKKRAFIAASSLVHNPTGPTRFQHDCEVHPLVRRQSPL